jgi:hypothetical protein
MDKSTAYPQDAPTTREPSSFRSRVPPIPDTTDPHGDYMIPPLSLAKSPVDFPNHPPPHSNH